jgi:hypothetical protein
MTRRRDQLNRIEALAERAETALARIEALLDPSTPGGLAVVAADAKGARSSAEASFAGVQALAAVATAKPGPAEVVAAIEQAGVLNRSLADGIREEIASVNIQVRSLAAAMVPKPKTGMPAPAAASLRPVASPAGAPGTNRGKGGTA